MTTYETKNEYDLIVVGAGIQGAGVAQAAAANHLKTLLLEKHKGPAQETSSKSSKLIHGGLRYLETLQFSLVRECLQEKNTLLHVAPDLVKPARFIIPVYRSSKRSPIWIQLGLCLYQLLGYPGTPVRGKYSQAEWQEHGPLQKKELRAIFEYQDAQTDDVELTNAVLRSAVSCGASIEYNCDIARVLFDATRKRFILFTQDGKRYVSRYLVNASGAWINEFAKCITPSPPAESISLVRGSHIILNRDAPQCCYYLESPDDQRAVFVLPWYGKTMVGTTEHEQASPESNPQPSEHEISYLLKSFNHYFPSLAAQHSDISAQFAGLRVLPLEGRSTNQKARDTRLAGDVRLPGYIAVVGGKLTAYRRTAEKVILLLTQKKSKNSTKDLPLTRN